MNKLRIEDAPIIVILTIAVQLLLSVFLIGAEGDAALYIGFLLPQIGNIAVVLIYTKFKKVSFFAAVPLNKKINPLSVLIVIAVAIGLYAQNLFLSVTFGWGMEAVGIKASVNIPEMNSALSVFLSVTVLCVIPAIGEEFVFRGAVLEALKSGKNPLFAVLYSAVLFSLIHLNAAQLVNTFITGFILGFITVSTGSIVYAIIVHFLNNFITIILPLAIPGYNNLGIISGNNALILAGIAVCGIIILYPAIYGFIKKSAPENSPNLFAFLNPHRNGANLLKPEKTPGELGVYLLAGVTALVLIINTVINSLAGA